MSFFYESTLLFANKKKSNQSLDFNNKKLKLSGLAGERRRVTAMT